MATREAARVPGPADVEPVAHESLRRTLTGLMTGVPMLALGVAAWRSWEGLLHTSDLIVFGLLYVLTGLGVTVGFHRLFAHRSFKTGRVVRAVLGMLGSAAVEGPVISWVADHRKHHAFADVRGDPHSPHVDYPPDLLADPVMRLVDRMFPAWAVGGLAVAFGLEYAIGGTVRAGLTGLLWGGGVRLFVLHHVTYGINSICHGFGRHRFATKDESRNVLWRSLFSFGESWHKDHHAFPTSARHGLRPWELDPSALDIRGLAACGLAWDVVGVSGERQARTFAPRAT